MSRVTWQDFGRCLQQARVRRGLSQEHLAELLGCHRIHIWRLEHAARRPSKRFLRSLHQACPVFTDSRLQLAFEQMAEYRCDYVEVDGPPQTINWIE